METGIPGSCVRTLLHGTAFSIVPVFLLFLASSVLASSTHSVPLLSPCGGSKLIETRSHLLSTTGDRIRLVDLGQSSDSARRFQTGVFRDLSQRATRLKNSVKQLKNLYVTMRRLDERDIEIVEEAGFKPQGLPDIRQPTLAVADKEDVLPLVHASFEDFLRIGVFIEQAKIGEILSTDQPWSFIEEFERLEHHPEHGLYWLLCRLHNMIQSGGQELQYDKLLRILRTKLDEPESRAIRHMRDLVALRSFEKLLNAFSIQFAAIDDSNTGLS